MPLDFDQVMNVVEKMQQSSANVFGLMVCIPTVVRELGLKPDQIFAFCDATPKGEELWRMFTTRRDSKETPDNYNFKSFMIEVLAKTDHPVRQ
mgnify:FL=1